MLRIRNNATIRPIIIPQDRLEYLQAYVTSDNNASWKNDGMIRKIAGRACCVCRDIPSTEVIYDVQGATMKERYCDKCMKSVFAREEVL